MHFVDATMFYAAEGGGVSTYINAKSRWLVQRSRVRHTIASPSVHPGPGAIRLPSVPVPGLHGYRWPFPLVRTSRLLQQAGPDLIEAGDAGPCAWAALRVRRQLDIPAVAFYHSDLPHLIRHRVGDAAMHAVRRYVAQLYRQFDMVLAPSRVMVQQLAGMGIRGAVHQPLGIDSTVFNPGRRIGTLRRHLRLPEDARLLVYAGRFTAEKKLTHLIEAVRKLGRPYHLLLIGGGGRLPYYPQISYLPFKRDQRALARLLASCDVLVHPGDCETFGLIVLEAMACGLPVVGARGGGVAELVDAHCGILAEPNSVDSLCAGIEGIYLEGREQRAQAALRKAREHYDWNHIMPQLMQRYASLLAARERADLGTELIYVPE
ncbi:MAG: glycosyltransferase [Gammaproteobacteria bacterium]